MRDEYWAQAITEAEYVRLVIDQHSLNMTRMIDAPLWASAG